MPETPLEESITRAATAIRSGDVAVFPTDTYFALGANVLNATAVQKIFTSKGRRERQPLPVLIHSLEQAWALCDRPPSAMRQLVELFWPGPLTIVIPRAAVVPAEVAGGGDTIGVRVPDHPVALELLRQADVPVTGTSANPSGKPPTKDPRQVSAWFDGRAAEIVVADCGPHTAPSTVVDLTIDPPLVLREGGVSLDSLRELLPGVTVKAER